MVQELRRVGIKDEWMPAEWLKHAKEAAERPSSRSRSDSRASLLETLGSAQHARAATDVTEVDAGTHVERSSVQGLSAASVKVKDEVSARTKAKARAAAILAVRDDGAMAGEVFDVAVMCICS